MKKSKIIDFQKIRRKTQIKDFTAFQLYLKNMFNELAIRDSKNKNEKVIYKLTFIKYMKIPFILGEKIFNSLDKDEKGYLLQNEFMLLMNLYIGDLEEVQNIIFNILDFDQDGIIIAEDSRLLVTFIKKIGISIKNVVKLKIKLKNEATEEENLQEINELISNFFNEKPKMTIEEYKYNINNINSDVFFVFIYYLYVNKPFSESSVKVLKMLNITNQGSLQNSFCSSVSSSGASDNGEIYENKSTITSGSRTLKSFIQDLVDVDIDDIESGCIENKNENITTNLNINYNIDEINENENKNFEVYENYEDYLLSQLTERKNKIYIPDMDLINENQSISKLKGNLDFICKNENNKIGMDKENLKNHKNNYNNLDKINSLANYDNEFSFNNKVYKDVHKKNNNNIDINKNIEIKNFNKNSDGINFTKKIEDFDKLKEIKNNLKVQKDKDNTNNNNTNIKINDNNSINNNNNNKFNIPIILNNSNKNVFSNKNSKKEDLNDNKEIKIHYDTIKISKFEENVNTESNININIQSKINTTNLLSGNNLYENEFLINPADFLYEGYIYKSRNGSKLRKYYLGIIGTDLVYFSNSKKKKLKGMHNLTGTYILEEDKINKVKRENEIIEDDYEVNTFYQFTLIFNKKKRSYFCTKEEDVKNWIKYIKKAINLRNINDYYELKNKIGEGKYGLVKGGIDKRTGEKVAIKIINKSKLDGIEMEMVMSEYEIIAFCRHPNIVKCYDHFEDYENIYIVLEYLLGGTLVNFLSNQDSILTEKKIKELVLQIAKGISYMHHFGIIHRDLKPENLMMTNKNYENSKLKIVDFGLSKILGIKEKTDESYGTLSFAAPEVVQNQSYTNLIDVWSLGIILYFLVTGNLPFSSKKKIFDEVVNEIKNAKINFDPKFWNRLSPYSKDLVKRSLEKYPHKRIKINEFIEHEWFKD